MRYSDDIIEEVRQKNDIVDVVSQYVRLTRRGSTYFGLCPFHNEKTPSFSVTPGKQMYYCFGCGAGGNVYNFIMEYENYTFGEALKHLADRAGVELPKIEYSREVREKAEQRAELLEINKQAAQYYYYQLRTEGGKIGYQYLSGRGLSEETMRKFGLGYSDKFGGGLYTFLKSKGYSDERLRESGLFNVDERHGMYDKFWNRVIFPIMDVNNRVIGFGGRVMGDGKPKYLNSPETKIFDKSRNLYGLNIARTTRKKYLILCEGYMDVISMHQAGFTNAVASLGTALTSGHASLLKRYTQEVLLLYDSDEAGIRAALRGIPILRDAGVSSRVVNLKPYKDPDEFIKNMGAEAFEERLGQASDSFMFRVSIAESEFPMDEPQGQNRFFERCAELLLELKDELERNLYIEAIVKKYRGQYGVSAEDLRKRVNTLALKGTPAENRTQPKTSGGQNKKKKESASDQAQKLMLTWLVTYPGIFDKVAQYLNAEDFIVPLYKEVAQMLFRQREEEGQVNPAKLLNSFTDSEEQREVASLFNATIHLETQQEQDRAFADTLLRIKAESLAEKNRNLDPTDMAGLQQILREKKELEELGRKRQELHISFE
ncbi:MULTISPECIES: DNA primase [Blautia]|uniref:DNA primase n=2 Tax=Blautia obeum TaxID=40520 RepID=D4LTY5_9FIRM|nr:MULTISPECIES: DNA primase [Blautia]RHA47305.1 DNA primase [Blautia obeum]RHD33031.1 DNA primase [Blautia obeum]RHE42054.1 DNA primase [Blautia obeum]CBL24243.1 DNA primase [Blautia obeum A2-162]